jgi:hypothetical protein
VLRVVIAVVLAVLVSVPEARAATVSVDPTRLGQRIPRSYLGFSVEWDSLAPYGRAAPSLRRLLAPVARSQGGLSLRVGGNSADASWWNPGGRRRPRIVLHDVDGGTLDHAAAVSDALGGGPVTLGVNLALRDPRNARTLVEEARRRFPVEAVELGNEPDLYTAARTFRVPGAVHRRVRKHARYTPGSYGRDVGRYMDALGDDARFSVGGFARPFWWSSLPRLLGRWRDRADILAVHMYAMPYCDAPPPPASWLMTREASRGLAAKIRPIARLARRRALSLRVSEMNSGVCGGRRGISDRSFAAVWLADILFALVSEGVRQTDVHTWRHAVYAPFAVEGTRARAQPALAGMLAFARAAPSGSRLAATRVSGGVRAWATRSRDGTVRVALVVPRAAPVRVAAPRRRCASVWVATPRGQGFRRCSARLALPARSVAVVRFAAR